MRNGLASLLVGLAALAGCGLLDRSSGLRADAPDRGPIYFDDLGAFHREMTTRVPEAARWLDQGLLLCYSFNHEEARRSFAEAARLDPDCAMAWWGVALAAGLHINNMEIADDQARAAHEAIENAVRLCGSATPVERDLIGAARTRFPELGTSDRKTLDLVYADAMRRVYQDHPDDPDVAALFAEALMDLRPWDLWSQDGEPRPETPEIVDVLDRLLARHPDHPAGLHYLIHALEASPHPEQAKDAADRLRTRVPGSGHMVHMPSHIDIRIGDYAAAIAANQRAIEVDRRMVARAGRGGLQEMYRAHDMHFLVWAAMYDGQEKVATDAARALVAGLPAEIVNAMPQFVEGFLATPYHVLIRFGRFEEILREPEPAAEFPGTRATRHYARAIALANTGRVDAADAERDGFEAEYKRVPAEWTVGNNTTRAVLDVARCMMEGEIEFRRGNHDLGLASLRRAVTLDDAMKYDEPWSWMMPARHSLGALLLDADRVDEAEAVYRADLVRHPENGWALFGLAECLRKRGDTAGAADAERRFAKAWARSDVKLRGSCFCRTAK